MPVNTDYYLKYHGYGRQRIWKQHFWVYRWIHRCCCCLCLQYKYNIQYMLIQNMPLIYDFCLNTIWDTQTHNLKCLCEASSYILFFCKGRHATLLNHFQIEHNLHNFITKNAFIKLKWLHSIINNEDGLWASILHYIWLNISLWKFNSFNNGVGIGKNNSITNISIKEKNRILNKISKPSNTKVWYTDDKQHMRNPKRY